MSLFIVYVLVAAGNDAVVQSAYNLNLFSVLITSYRCKGVCILLRDSQQVDSDAALFFLSAKRLHDVSRTADGFDEYHARSFFRKSIQPDQSKFFRVTHILYRRPMVVNADDPLR